jgi:hypothetical protein
MNGSCSSMARIYGMMGLRCIELGGISWQNDRLLFAKKSFVRVKGD